MTLNAEIYMPSPEARAIPKPTGKMAFKNIKITKQTHFFHDLKFHATAYE
jgi:hypothetical protein